MSVCMCLCVHVFLCMCVSMSVCLHVYSHVGPCVHVLVHLCVCVYAHARAHAHMCEHVTEADVQSSLIALHLFFEAGSGVPHLLSCCGVSCLWNYVGPPQPSGIYLDSEEPSSGPHDCFSGTK